MPIRTEPPGDANSPSGQQHWPRLAPHGKSNGVRLKGRAEQRGLAGCGKAPLSGGQGAEQELGRPAQLPPVLPDGSSTISPGPQAQEGWRGREWPGAGRRHMRAPCFHSKPKSDRIILLLKTSVPPLHLQERVQISPSGLRAPGSGPRPPLPLLSTLTSLIPQADRVNCFGSY